MYGNLKLASQCRRMFGLKWTKNGFHIFNNFPSFPSRTLEMTFCVNSRSPIRTLGYNSTCLKWYLILEQS